MRPLIVSWLGTCSLEHQGTLPTLQLLSSQQSYYIPPQYPAAIPTPLHYYGCVLLHIVELVLLSVQHNKMEAVEVRDQFMTIYFPF